MVAKDILKGPSIEVYPEIPLGDHVKDYLTFYALVNDYYNPEGLTKAAQQADEVESLRVAVGYSIGVDITEVDIVLGLNNLVTDIK